MTHPYTVALEDAAELPSSNRITAEARFAAIIVRHGHRAIARRSCGSMDPPDFYRRTPDCGHASVACLFLP